VFNIVPHPFLFTHLDFCKTKKIIRNYPTCIIVPEEIKDSCGINPFRNLKTQNSKFDNNINFNKLKYEYSSVHLVKQALGIYKEHEITHFYLIILDENKLNNFFFYYLLLNTSRIQNLVNEILINSPNLNVFISKFQNCFGCNSYISHLKTLLNL
jgi:hypothetical protein